MKAIILAAGIASRLRPLTNDRPKCLLKIGDRSLLERTIDALLENNIREIIIVTGYLHDMLETFVQTRYPSLNVKFIHNELYSSTNNIYSLWLALPKVLQEKEIILLDSDILFDPLMIKILLDASHDNCLALDSHKLGEEEIKVIGIRHGEKMYETLLTNEECVHAVDMGRFFRVPADTRDLNYDKFVVKGEVHTMADESYTSHNTNRLDVEGTVKKIMTTEYVQNELKGIPNV